MSWDKNIVIKEYSEPFYVICDYDHIPCKSPSNRITAEKINHNIKIEWNNIIGEAKDYKSHQKYRFQLNSIYKKLCKNKISITDTYENWIKVAFAIASNIHPEKGRELFLKLCELDGINNDRLKSEKLIFDAYATNKGYVGFNTILYLARQKGININ